MRGKGGKADGRNSGVTIIRKEEVTSAESHGGAWKVAYADFVTAMMAFFLLMWLLNATTEDQRKGLADYFSPTNLLSHASSGTGQPFGGHTAFDQGEMVSDRGAVQVVVGKRPVVEDPADDDADTRLLTDPHGAAAESGPEGKTDAAAQGSAKTEHAPPVAASLAARGPAVASLTGTSTVVANPAAAGGTAAGGVVAANPAAANSAGSRAGAAQSEAAKPADGGQSVSMAAHAEMQPGSQASPGAEASAEQQRQEKQAFEQAAEQIREAVRVDPALAGLSQQLAVDVTPEGLRIQLLDADRKPMFATGSAAPNDRARLLLAKVAPVLKRLPEDIAVVGHTDAAPYAGNGKTNWELSTERANATRRLLTDAGLVETRVSRVTGLADRDPLVPDDPLAAANRRIAIIVLGATSTPTAPAGGSAAPPVPSSTTPSAPSSIGPSVPSSVSSSMPSATPKPASAAPTPPAAATSSPVSAPSSVGAAVSSGAAPTAASGAAAVGGSSAPTAPPSVPASMDAPARSSAPPPTAAPVPASAPATALVPALPPIAAPIPASAPSADTSADTPSGPPPAPSFAPSFVPSFAPSLGPSGGAGSPPIPP